MRRPVRRRVPPRPGATTAAASSASRCRRASRRPPVRGRRDRRRFRGAVCRPAGPPPLRVCSGFTARRTGAASMQSGVTAMRRPAAVHATQCCHGRKQSIRPLADRFRQDRDGIRGWRSRSRSRSLQRLTVRRNGNAACSGPATSGMIDAPGIASPHCPIKGQGGCGLRATVPSQASCARHHRTLQARRRVDLERIGR